MSVDPIYFTQSQTPRDDELSPEALLVREVLVSKGLETPMIDTGLSNQMKYLLKALLWPNSQHCRAIVVSNLWSET